MHERLWQAYQAHPALRIVIESAPGQAGHDLQTFSSNLHRFWRARGFQLRCHQTKDKSGFHAWLEAV